MEHQKYLNELAEITEDDGFPEDAEKLRDVACELERLLVIVNKLPNRCQECRVYFNWCGSKYDGVCKHSGLPPTTQLGRPTQIWRHVYRYDSCPDFVKGVLITKAKAVKGKHDSQGIQAISSLCQLPRQDLW